MRTVAVLLALLVLLAPTSAQDFESADQHALAAPPRAATSVSALAAYLRHGLTSKEDKARTLYRWMCENIAYDVEAFLQGTRSDTSPEAVLASRKTICDGYARLYQAIAREMGLEAAHVVGVARGVGAGSNGHAWNAVRLSHGWILVDSCWGAGTVSVEKRLYEPGFTSFYFATDPTVFITSHFPDDPSWQLVPKPLTRAEYDQLHKIRESYADRAHPGPTPTMASVAPAPPRSLYPLRMRGVEILAPTAGTLKAGETEEFHVRALGASRIVVVSGGVAHPLPSAHPGEFSGPVPLTRGHVRVMGDFTGGRLEPLLEYSAQ